jgi:excisionase family DNA binding protein
MSVLTVRQVAERLQVSQAAVYDLCRERRLAHFRVGLRRGAIRVNEEDLAAFISAATVRPGAPMNAAGLRHIMIQAAE